ncbi:uncharacterized protein LOC111033287 [Myzus persicae]|uniref:uncharacterized protein LOC111033287 n=1 Tax=Myzus persicae TaxID=13164 RepID=UPI000B930251|nr:uncharacterized protein LOC111033287 [Myzus persicae]
MSVRSVLNNFNKGFLICGFGSINYSQSNFKMSVVFYILRCILICTNLYACFRINLLFIKVDQELSELTSLIYIGCFEIYLIGNIICYFWRVFVDNQLSMVLNKLGAIHEKLIRLKVVGPMKIKMNCYFIIGIIVYVIGYIITPLVWILFQNQFEIDPMVSFIGITFFEFVIFNEYILLILYIKWIVYVINEQIPERRSCLSTFRDMYLEVMECLHQINTSINGLPAIFFIAANVGDIIFTIYACILFPRAYMNDPYFIFSSIYFSMKIVKLLMLYVIGDATENEINRVSDVLHQRSVIEKNPRIKRQIKIFLLRKLHEHYNFELYGICHINLRQLHSLSSKAIGYLVIQILFKLNK